MMQKYAKFACADTLILSLLPCGHPAITDTPIIRTTAKFHAKTN